jgi:hypothetical protein
VVPSLQLESRHVSAAVGDGVGDDVVGKPVGEVVIGEPVVEVVIGEAVGEQTVTVSMNSVSLFTF